VAPYLFAGLAALFLGVWIVLSRGARRRREQGRRLARELLPEIRSIVASADPHGSTAGRPAEAVVYRHHRDELETALPSEARFAVEVFYRSVEAYGEARRAAIEAFRDDSELSLGDRIRAKDRRDRCLKDVYYTGEAAAQKLEAIR
jgi:hypothetical protein